MPDLTGEQMIAQLPNEPDLWHARFWNFLMLGAKRSLLAVYKQELAREGRIQQDRQPKTVPPSWYEKARAWQWEMRAREWDQAQRQKDLEAYEQSRLEERQHRMTIVRALRGKVAERLSTLAPEELRARDVIEAARMLNNESRMEHGDLPPQRHAAAAQQQHAISGQVESVHTFDLSKLSVEELEQLDRILAVITPVPKE